jgi:PhnB protein
MAAKPIPDGYRTVTPYLSVRGVARLVDFVQRALGATVTFQMPGPDGGVSHAEFRIGDSMVMAGEAHGEWPPRPATLYLYVPDVDAAFRRAVEAGAEVVRPVTDQFYGDRSGGVQDSCGNQWWIATHVEDVPMEEMKRRMAAMGK